MEVLVVYFSRGDENYNVGEVEIGNTELVAKAIIQKLGADEFKIEPKIKYPASYNDAVEVSSKERSENARPEYFGEIDINKYDTIFIGYPIWWDDLPMVVYSFLENHDFSGKTVIPFNTHEGSGNARTYEILKEKLAGARIEGDGFNLTGAMARSERGIRRVEAWLNKLGF